MSNLSNWLRPPKPACRDGACHFRRQPDVIHHSLDGRVFRVRRQVCALCGRRKRVAEKQKDPQTDGFSEPWWMADAMVEANF
ncbi:MAG: hypothetical protein OXP66_16065 [Candidatus Tectomicrobia bacterium]|nr:hypothetical protein [Candidatus Tectomicrobia bacterium]